MQITVNIVLAPDDVLNMTPDEIAVAVLQGLNGDESKDTVMSSVQQLPETGTAGQVLIPPEGPQGPVT